MQVAVANKWVDGLRVFLCSVLGQAFFQAMLLEDRRKVIEGLFRRIVEMEDKKSKSTFAHRIVEEILTKRPFASALVLAISQIEAPAEVDGKKYVSHCLRNLTGEDFVWLHLQG